MKHYKEGCIRGSLGVHEIVKVYLPRSQMTFVLIGKGLVLEG